MKVYKLVICIYAIYLPIKKSVKNILKFLHNEYKKGKIHWRRVFNWRWNDCLSNALGEFRPSKIIKEEYLINIYTQFILSSLIDLLFSLKQLFSLLKARLWIVNVPLSHIHMALRATEISELHHFYGIQLRESQLVITFALFPFPLLGIFTLLTFLLGLLLSMKLK